MIGALAGDIIGSIFEYKAMKSKRFPLFTSKSEATDDSILTIAIAAAILGDGDYRTAVRAIGRRYPDCGYGNHFCEWLFAKNAPPYHSYGNGSAMRASPVGWAFDDEEAVLTEARRTAEFTHNHPEGIKGAQAAALATFLARKKADKEQIRRSIGELFGYDLDRSCDGIRKTYGYDITCQGTVPEAIIAFLDSTSFEDSIRNAISLGGDADTVACITGGMAEPFYGGVPTQITTEVERRVPKELMKIVTKFHRKYCRL